MPDNSKRLILLILGITGVLLSTALLLYAVMMPPALNEETSVTSPRRSAPERTDDDRNAIAFDGLAEKRLQGPLEDPPQETLASVKEAVKIPPPPPRLSANLIGTLLDSDPQHRAAWIEVDGNTQRYRIGDEIRQAGMTYTLQSIADGKVTVEANGRTTELKADRSSTLPGGEDS
ncbi:MAG: type II secretion system protein N [Planctomycetota bacterium]